jgi:hypothetical protein
VNPESLVYKGQIAVDRSRRMNLDAEASGIITNLRILLRLGQEPVQIKIDEAKALLSRLDTVLAEIKVIDKRIAELESAIG